MRQIAIVVALLYAPYAGAAQAPDKAEQRARWEQTQLDQRKFERKLFAEAGFAPIAEMLVEKREVRRVLLQDPYMILAVPGIELERRVDGSVTLRLQYQGWSSPPAPVDRAAWDELARLEPEVFAKPALRVTRSEPAPSSPPPHCHGWMARIQADHERITSWTTCSGGGLTPAAIYASRLAGLAVSTTPKCKVEQGNEFWSFTNCFKVTFELDDPALEAQFAALRKDYDEAPGAERLAEARNALRAPGLALGNEAWLAAREAIRRFRETHSTRQDRLQKLEKLYRDATNASDGDRAKMRRAIEHWSDFLRSTETNYSRLLQDLAWASR